jgi:hypothetical protein
VVLRAEVGAAERDGGASVERAGDAALAELGPLPAANCMIRLAGTDARPGGKLQKNIGGILLFKGWSTV